MKLNRQQLLSVKRLLKQARELVADAQATFNGAGDADPSGPADGLRDIGQAIADEIDFIDNLLADAGSHP
jgi:hypothetical protein